MTFPTRLTQEHARLAAAKRLWSQLDEDDVSVVVTKHSAVTFPIYTGDGEFGCVVARPIMTTEGYAMTWLRDYKILIVRA